MNKFPLELNPKQEEAASHIEGPMMVLAGPGTGKTQIVAARIARILEQSQLSPHNILCLTFTESGVVAMRKRLISVIGNAAYQVRIHTFHSFCNEVIKDNPEIFSHARNLEPLDDLSRIQIFRRLIDGLEPKDPLKPFADPYMYQGDFIRLVQTLKREDISPARFSEILDELDLNVKQHRESIEAFIATHGAKVTEEMVEAMRAELNGSVFAPVFMNFPAPVEKKERTQVKNELKKFFLDLEKQLPKQRTLQQIYEGYEAILKKDGLYDFEDMILFVVSAFKKEELLLARYQEQFQYILVDEYQDTNGAQNEVVQLIAEFFEAPNLFVVGDDKQSIYRFQGASLENILYFYRRYQGQLRVVSLEENYRSHQGILDASHALIQHSEHRLSRFIPELDRALTAAMPIPTQPIEVHELDQASTEHYFLAKKIQSLIQSGVLPSEIAVFFRNNYEAEPLVDLFTRLELPFRLERGGNVLEDLRICQLLELLRWIQEPGNAARAFQVLHYDFLGFQPLHIHRLMRLRSETKEDFFELLLQSESFAGLAEKLLHWQHLSHNRPIVELLDHVLRESGYLDFILSSEEKVEHLNRLNSFFDAVRQMNRNHPQMKLSDLMTQLDLIQENEVPIREHELRTRADAVRLMTAHKSKGLEFEHVFIMNCVDKHWGNAQKIERLKLPPNILKNDPTASVQESNEDERRLFYVAVTRAKKNLYISYSKTKDNGRPQLPSMFISELGDEHLRFMEEPELEEEALNRLQTLFLELPAQDHSEEEKEFARSLLQNYTMSVTHLNNYLTCPRLFYYRNLLKVPSAMSKHAAFGSAMHEALRTFTLRHKEGTLPSKAFLLDEFERQLTRQILSEQDYQNGLHLGKETLSDYYDEYKEEFSPQAQPEYDFSSHGVHLDGIRLTGRLDQLIIKDGMAEVVDFKTGNPDTKAAALQPDGDYHRQIVFYKLLCELSPKFPYPMKSGVIQFLQKSKKDDRFKRAVIKVTDEDMERLKTQIRSVYEDIQNLAFLKVDEFSSCGECDYCHFFKRIS